MDFNAQIYGYHTNSVDKCTDFMTSSKLVWSKEDGFWLGCGMYFWDNLYNAKFWLSKKKKDGSGDVKIIIALLSLNNLLDLTDIDICNFVNKCWEYMAKQAKISLNAPLGKKINFLFDNTESFNSNYGILRVFGEYINTPETALFEYNPQNIHAQTTKNTKCIYCVKRVSNILDKKFYEE